MEKVNECHKGINLIIFFRNFLWKNKNVRVCLITIFPPYFLFPKTIFLFLRLKNLFGNAK